MNYPDIYYKNQKHLNNTISFFDELLFEEENLIKAKIILSNTERITYHSTSGLQWLYENRDYNSVYNFLDRLKVETEQKIIDSNLILKEERLIILKNFHKTICRIYKKKPKKEFSLKQQVLILEYLGMLKPINNLDINDKEKAKIVSIILDKDISNTTKALRNIAKVSEKGEHTKTRINLEKVSAFFDDCNLKEITNKVQEDLIKLN